MSPINYGVNNYVPPQVCRQCRERFPAAGHNQQTCPRCRKREKAEKKVESDK